MSVPQLYPASTFSINNERREDILWLNLLRDEEKKFKSYMQEEGSRLSQLKNHRDPDQEVPKWFHDASKPRPHAKLQWKMQRTLWKVAAESGGRPHLRELEYSNQFFQSLPPIQSHGKEGENWGDVGGKNDLPIQSANIHFVHRGPWGKPSDPTMFDRLSQPKPLPTPILPPEMSSSQRHNGPVSQQLFERLHTQKPIRNPALPAAMFENKPRPPASKGLYERLSIPKIREVEDNPTAEKIVLKLNEKTLSRLSMPKKLQDPFIFLPKMKETDVHIDQESIQRLAAPKNPVKLPEFARTKKGK
ncbi:hypothetical protein HK098_001304 [Nowakowskiella sp. JEL0407]|nr:hypothetical protein HK098_001304 [Nowakowskiella sp. JEL0407]